MTDLDAVLDSARSVPGLAVGLLHATYPRPLAEVETPGGIIIKGNSPVTRYLRYTPTGQTKRLGGAFQAGTLTLCHSSGNQPVRRLILNAAGRLRSAVDSPGNC